MGYEIRTIDGVKKVVNVQPEKVTAIARDAKMVDKKIAVLQGRHTRVQQTAADLKAKIDALRALKAQLV